MSLSDDSIPGYQILGPLGWQGEVFAAMDSRTGEKVALKRFAGDEEGSRRFQKELGLLSALVHPNIIAVKGAVYGASGAHFLVLELADGGSLRDQLWKRERFPENEALDIVAQVAEALSVAHERGIVHRDLKPENILLVEGRVKLADLGIARSVAEYARLDGSPAYMAPEQFYDQPAPASDLYALGILLYELLTGEVPFLGSHQELCLAHAQQAPDWSKVAAFGSAGLLESLLAKDPSERPASALAVADRCRLLLGQGGRQRRLSPPSSSSLRLDRVVRRELPGAHRLFAPFRFADDVWVAGAGGTDLFRQGRYHPQILAHSVQALSRSSQPGSPVYYASPHQLFRLDAERYQPIRLFDHRTAYQAMAHDDRRLYLLDRNRLEACDLSGNRLWHASCRNFGARPQLALYAGGAVLVTSSGARNELRCFDGATGRLRWLVTLQGLPAALAASPTSNRIELYLCNLCGPRSYLQLWRLRQDAVLEQIRLHDSVASVRGCAEGSTHLRSGRVQLYQGAQSAGSFSLGGALIDEAWNPAQHSFAWLEQTTEGRTFFTHAHYPANPRSEERTTECSSTFISSGIQATG